MQIIFNVSAINTRVNPKDNSEFKSISLFKEVKKVINGTESIGRLYADHACVSTELKVGDTFLFDSKDYNMVQRTYVDEQGVTKTANTIYLKVGE